MELLAVVFYQKIFHLKMKSLFRLFRLFRLFCLFCLFCLFTLLLILSSCHSANPPAETQSTDRLTVMTTAQERMAVQEEQHPLTDDELTALLTPNDGEVLLLGLVLYIPQQDWVRIEIQHAGGAPVLYRYSPKLSPIDSQAVIVQNRMITTQPEYNPNNLTPAAVLCTPDYSLDGCPIQPEHIKVIVLGEVNDFSDILPYLPGQTYPTPVFPTEYAELAEKPSSNHKLGYVIEAGDGSLCVAKLPRLSVDLKTFGVERLSNQLLISYDETTVCTENGAPFDPETLKLGDIIAFRSGEGAVLQESAPARLTGILREIVVLGHPVR